MIEDSQKNIDRILPENSLSDNIFRLKAMTLIELLIAISIIGILAAITFPSIMNHIQRSKESNAKSNLNILRNVMERYTIDHSDKAPGYLNSFILPGVTFPLQLANYSNINGVFQSSKSEEFCFGPYLKDIPENPFNSNVNFLIINDGQDFPGTPTGNYGWIYKPQTMELRIDFPGTDSNGNKYYDY
jgi:prepilin-type N-terminal cleavage/methylation domain-containing protein